jgi:hypothetical protein
MCDVIETNEVAVCGSDMRHASTLADFSVVIGRDTSCCVSAA